MKFSRRVRDPVEVNLTPLIDVVFLLLIFFMVSTTFETRQALELVLPESLAGQTLENAPLTLAVDAQGGYVLEGERVASESLGAALAAVPTAPERGLVIEADARAQHGAVVVALDQASMLGISRVHIATRDASHSTTRVETP